MEQVDGAPKQFVEFGFKSGIAQRGDQGVDDICDGGGDLVALRQWAGIGFILIGTPGCCQTDENSSQFPSNGKLLGYKKATPLGESGGAVQLEILSAV